MSLTNARTFVSSLKENNEFRNKVLSASNTEAFVKLLNSIDLFFTQRELVGAMIECMGEQESQVDTTTD